MSNPRIHFAVAVLAGVLMAVQVRQPAEPSAVVNGLQMSVSHDDTAPGPDKTLYFTVTFRNTRPQGIIITPGTTYNCGHEGSKTQFVKMNLTDASGVPHRHLEFLGSGPPYEGGLCAGRIDFFEVTLKSGEAVTLPLTLAKYLDLSNSKQYDQAHFHAGTYSLQMELTGPPMRYVDGRPTPPGVWVGTVTSNILQVHFDKEFAALVSDLPEQ
jgi:hypothetical protein